MKISIRRQLLTTHNPKIVSTAKDEAYNLLNKPSIVCNPFAADLALNSQCPYHNRYQVINKKSTISVKYNIFYHFWPPAVCWWHCWGPALQSQLGWRTGHHLQHTCTDMETLLVYVTPINQIHTGMPYLINSFVIKV